jgi:hypothetical protein
MSTLEYGAYFYDDSSDPASSSFEGQAIFLFWHEYIPFPLYLRGHCNIAMLVSRHLDAEWLSLICAAHGLSNREGLDESRRSGRPPSTATYLPQNESVDHSGRPTGQGHRIKVWINDSLLAFL